MQTYFNNEELNLIQNKLWFEMKASSANKTSAFLHEIDKSVRLKPEFVFNRSGGASKITKGENLNGFPYFVLDVPKLNEGNSIFSLRIIVWWGNYISVNLLLSEEVYERYKKKIVENISLIQSNDLFLGLAENHWQHDVLQEKHYIKSSEVNTELLNNLKIFKITSMIELNSINNIDGVLNAVDLLNRLLI